MKYIRTKDTLASVEREEDIELFKRVGQKVADTIEELCDVFVYEQKSNHELYDILCKNKENDINYIKNGTSIYGAIWTKKGLIYVAKMNKKGELELL